ncbi:hypothetical protein GMORB2_2681 [Geosmithia morbida]|uniref:Uncharacterized protein n=1 Tax=Geosmithia morbida TaxID=1094350 RepID=A0A9P5CYP9_9HYPO|nr:uncharacterized protein GMORB2_2681 [Geosmithia morbida]KAF4120678.1 hypothetical protein GMORB2_2681 [Geosmithia morbida]
MIIRDVRRVAMVLVPVFILLYGSFILLNDKTFRSASTTASWLGHSAKKIIKGAGGEGGSSDSKDYVLTSSPEYHELSAISTPDGSFFAVDMMPRHAINPNIIPHPRLMDTWIVVAQSVREDNLAAFVELVCNAAFRDGALRCLQPAAPLPIRPTQGGHHCQGDLAYFNLNVGPHDARVLVGPKRPFVVFGSNSVYTCFGQFIQDLDALVEHEWGGVTGGDGGDYRVATELQRPGPWNSVEKNWFPFWDSKDELYVHYDISPSRAFARVYPDGSAGPNLAVLSAASDAACMRRYMPALGDAAQGEPRSRSRSQSLHQATNSLRVTMCERRGSPCTPDDDNTYIFAIYQHKTFHNLHAVYEPFVLMFRQVPPFDMVAMSRTPLWIRGRHMNAAREVSEMLYVTSISWKSGSGTGGGNGVADGNGYHGYLDDEMFIAFGIEDERTGAIDVLAKDVLGDIALCGL